MCAVNGRPNDSNRSLGRFSFFHPCAELEWVGCSCCPICQSDGLELREYIRLATASRDEEFAVPLPCSRTLGSRHEHLWRGYRHMHKVSRFRWISISAVLLALSLPIASVQRSEEHTSELQSI